VCFQVSGALEVAWRGVRRLRSRSVEHQLVCLESGKQRGFIVAKGIGNWSQAAERAMDKKYMG
jgi:hypothetical protein